MSPEKVPVLIVGGGIVGLSASLFLSHQGIHSLLVERHSGTSIHPRARGVNGRTMELYREIGLEDEVRAAGAELQAAIGLLQGETLIAALKDHGPEQHKQMLAAFQKMVTSDEISPTTGSRGTQDLVEPLVRKAASQRGGDLRFSTELVSFEQSAEGVTALIRDRINGVTSYVHADYMLAADGANSPVLCALGIPSRGSGPLGYLLNVLFQADLRDVVRGREFSICKIERPEVTGLFVSINNSDRWCFHILYDPQKGEKPEDYPAERCQELIRLALGLPSIEIEIKNVLPWVSTVRVAETFQQGRVFIAGDAAHQMPPWGGQGANTGIPDAHNLAWKLAAVLKGEAEPALLDTYNVERHPVGQVAAEMSGQRSDQRGLLSFENMTSQVANKPFQAGNYFQMLGGYGYKYRSQAIIVDGDDDSLDLNGQPGTRTPHMWVEYEGKRVSTLDLFGRSFVLLTGQDGSPWCRAASKVAVENGIEIKAYRVGPDADLHDPENQWIARAGINADGALLVRPDGFVAWRSSKLMDKPEHVLEQALAHLLCRVSLR